MDGTLAAFGATGLYYVGFAIFKVAADRMAPVRGHRIHHMAGVILTSPIFLAGLVLVLGGLSLQIIALSELALSVAVPIFVSGLVPLLVIAIGVFGERLAFREWLSLALVAGAMLLIAASIGTPEPITADDVGTWRLAAVVIPPLVLSLGMMAMGDRRPDGRHARPVAGVAYGMSAGFPIGTAELAVKGWSDSSAEGLAILGTPFPYVTVLAAAFGFGIIVAAFQRCRVSVVASVMTVTAKTYLLVMGTILYGEPWPDDPVTLGLRIAALALAIFAVLLFPRYDDELEPRLPADLPDSYGHEAAPYRSPMPQGPLSAPPAPQGPQAPRGPHGMYGPPPQQPYGPPGHRTPRPQGPQGPYGSAGPWSPDEERY
ncbi:hypothetical protein [Thermomonospora umbrina]|nr:hypothetical protein [Thermomonospora umbrina]